jgi:uncharacterized protein
VTLGVVDLERSRHFYEQGLGWKPAKGSDDNIVFLSAGAVILALYPRHRLADDAHLVSVGIAPRRGHSLVPASWLVDNQASECSG